MRAILRSLIAALTAAASLAACGGGSSSPTPTPGPTPFEVSGFFAGCRNEAGPDTFDAYAFEGNRIVYRYYTGYGSTDGSCAGTQHLASTAEGTFELGAELPVPNLDPLATTSLTARAMDIHLDRGGTVYGLVYLKPGTTEVVYTGDRSGARDGSTAALRPDRLAPYGRPRIAAPAAWPALLSGTWRACRNDGGNDFVDVVALGTTGEVSSRTYAFTSTRLTCAGAPAVARGADGTVLLRPGADPAGAVTIGTGPVAVTGAHALDVTFVGTQTTATLYAIGWVDALSAPEAFYLGDDQEKTVGNSSTARMTALQPFPRYRIATPAAPVYTIAGLAGTWEKCRYDEGLMRDVKTRAVLGATDTDNFTVHSWSYTSTNRTCTGGEAPVETQTATYAFRTAGTTTGTGVMLGDTGHGFPVVTHLADFSGGFTATIAMYVDHLSGRPMLFFEKSGTMDYIGSKVP